MIESQRLASTAVSQVLAGRNLNQALQGLLSRQSSLSPQQRAAAQDMSYGTLPSVLPFVESGQLKLIAVAEPKRISELPNLPTINETVPGVETTTWVGVLAPAETPKDVRGRLYQAISDALKLPDVQAKMSNLGMKPFLQTPEQFDSTIVKDLGFWKSAIEKAGIEKR